MWFVIQADDAPQSMPKRRAVREAHLAYLKQLQQQNRLLVAGPLLLEATESASQVTGSLIIAEFNSADEAKAWAAADPYATAEVYQRIQVTPFMKTF